MNIPMHKSGRLRSARGISLLEVLIALAIMGVVTTAIFRLYITQHNNYMVQDDVTRIQQNVRASIDEMTRHARMAGYGLPPGIPPLVVANTNPDTITINYRSNECYTFLSAPMPQPSAELKCATDVSCFHDGQWVYIFEPDSGGGEWFQITEVQTGSDHLQHNTMNLSRAYGKDAIILTMEQVTFYVDNTNPDSSRLMVKIAQRPAQIYADFITDLQFRYRMKNNMVLDEPINVDDIREVLISVRGRSGQPDYERERSGVTGDSLYRYRDYQTSVYLRNSGGA